MGQFSAGLTANNLPFLWLGLCALLVVFVAGLLARELKGRSAILWMLIASAVQVAVMLVPAMLILILVTDNPIVNINSVPELTASLLQLLAELSVGAGLLTLVFLALTPQRRWKICPACLNRSPWRATHCISCGSEQPPLGMKRRKFEPGSYPRLKARMVFLPIDLDRRLSKATKLRRRGADKKLPEEAIASRLIEKVLTRHAKELD